MKQTNSKGSQSDNTFENWLSGKVEYEISRFSPDERKKIHNKSKELLITEADNRFKKEKDRIEKSLLSVPSREKFIQSEIDILYRILHKDIDYMNDCVKDMTAGQKTIYYKTGRFDIDIKQIESIRHNYRLYFLGTINYMGRTPAIDDKAECIILAIKFYKLDEWLSSNISIKPVNSEYTVKSIIIAYFYMYKKGIYPIPEITQPGKKLKFYKALEKKYNISYNSVKNDWKPLEEKSNRTGQQDSIKLAISLLKTFDYPNINEVIELANCELKEAELLTS